MAWLNAAPRSKDAKPGAPEPVSRLEQMRRQRKDTDYEPPLPPVAEHAAYLLNYLFEIGPLQPGPAGPAVFSHQEVAAWSALTATPLQPWEARHLRHLSRAFLQESQAAEDAHRPAPWGAAPTNLAAVATSMRQSIAAMAKE